MDYVKKIWDKAIQDFVKKNDIEGLERYYQDVILKTTGIDEDTRREYEEIVDDAISEVNNKLQNINAEDITVGETAKHFKLSKKKIAIISGAIGAVVALAGVTIGLVGCSRSNKGSAEAKSKISSDYAIELDFSLDDGAEIGLGMNANKLKPTLHFNPEKTETMIGNMTSFLTDALPKGIEIKEETVDNELESFIDYYVALNIDEIGPGYMSKLYQTDNKSYLDVFNNYLHWAIKITDEAMMSSKQDNTTIDITSLVANKNESQILQNVFNLIAQIHDDGLSGNVEALKANSSELNQILYEVLVNEKNLSYTSSSKVMLAYLAMNADTLLKNYNDIKIVDDDIRKAMYEDAVINCALTIKEKPNISDREWLLLLNASETNQAGINLVEQLEKKFDQEVLIVSQGVDFSKELSVIDVIERVKAGIDLSTYKANQEYTEYNALTMELNHPKKEIPDGAVVIDNGNRFIEKEEIDKYNIDTNGKTPSQIEQEYQQAVKNEVESSLSNEKNFTDNKGEVLESGVNSPQYAEEYSNGFGAGSKQGAIDGNALTTYNATVTGSVAYQEGYKAGYERSYEKAKQTRLNIERQSNVTIETIKPVEQSSQVTEQGTYSQPETKKSTVENPQQSTSAPSTKEEETTTGIIEEVVIDEGILEEGVTSVSEVDYLTFLRDYLQSYNQTSMEEETKKTR